MANLRKEPCIAEKSHVFSEKSPVFGDAQTHNEKGPAGDTFDEVRGHSMKKKYLHTHTHRGYTEGQSPVLGQESPVFIEKSPIFGDPQTHNEGRPTRSTKCTASLRKKNVSTYGIFYGKEPCIG